MFECLGIDERRGRGGPLKRAEGHKPYEGREHDQPRNRLPNLFRPLILAEQAGSAFGFSTQDPFRIPQEYEGAARILLRRCCDWLRSCLGEERYATRLAGVPIEA